MSEQEGQSASARVESKRQELGEDFSIYALLVLGQLADEMPERIEFVMDQADSFFGLDA